MGTICLERATGKVREWVRHGTPATYDAAIHDLMASEVPPPDGSRWDGTAWVALAPPTSAEKDADLQAFLDSAGGKIVKAIATVMIQKNVCTLADLKAAYRAL